MGRISFLDQFDLVTCIKILALCFNGIMSSEYQNQEKVNSELTSHGKVKLTDLLTRINEEKKIERNRNLVLSVAAVSAVTVFGIILTL